MVRFSVLNYKDSLMSAGFQYFVYDLMREIPFTLKLN